MKKIMTVIAIVMGVFLSLAIIAAILFVPSIQKFAIFIVITAIVIAIWLNVFQAFAKFDDAGMPWWATLILAICAIVGGIVVWLGISILLIK